MLAMCYNLLMKGDVVVNEILMTFLEEEVTSEQYHELFDFVMSAKITRGTFVGSTHTLLKTSDDTFIIFREILTPEKTLKYENAVVVGKCYLIKKINSTAYSKKIQNIRNITD